MKDKKLKNKLILQKSKMLKNEGKKLKSYFLLIT